MTWLVGLALTRVGNRDPSLAKASEVTGCDGLHHHIAKDRCFRGAGHNDAVACVRDHLREEWVPRTAANNSDRCQGSSCQLLLRQEDRAITQRKAFKKGARELSHTLWNRLCGLTAVAAHRRGHVRRQFEDLV